MTRSPTFERQWFEQMVRVAERWGHDSRIERFVDAVKERLEKGAREYGENAWTEKPIPELVREAIEEGHDVPGWLVLTAQKLNDEAARGLVSSDKHGEIQERYVRAAAFGLLLAEELAAADREYRVAVREAEWRAKIA